MNQGIGPMPFDDMVKHVNQGGGQLYDAIRKYLNYKKDLQTFRKMHWYTVDGSLAGQDSAPYFITTDQGFAFDCKYATGYAYSYDDGNDTDFPAPNIAGSTAWAADGLSVSIKHSNDGTDFMNGAIPFKLLFAPGYSISFQNALPFEYIFPGNSKIKFDMTNRDNANRTHTFAIVLGGFLVSSQ
jgi:hypothetical protein